MDDRVRQGGNQHVKAQDIDVNPVGCLCAVSHSVGEGSVWCVQAPYN